jgi:hypothetical protein
MTVMLFINKSRTALLTCFILLAASCLFISCASDDDNNSNDTGFLFDVPDEYPPTNEAFAADSDDDNDDDSSGGTDGETEEEPNDTLQSATFLGTPNPSLNTAGAIDAIDDLDYYRFTVGTLTRIRITLRWSSSDAFLMMQLFNQNSDLIATTGLDGSSPLVIEASLVESQYYYINIASLNGTTNYTISIVATEDAVADVTLDEDITEDLIIDAFATGGEDEIVDQISGMVQVGDRVVYDGDTYNVLGISITKFPPPNMLYNEGTLSVDVFTLLVPPDTEADPPRDYTYVINISVGG